MFKVNTIKTPQRRHQRRSGVFAVNFEHILHLILVFLLLTLNKKMLAGILITATNDKLLLKYDVFTVKELMMF